MRTFLVILACGMGPIGGLALELGKCVPAGETAQSCCCCPSGQVCRCSCGPAKNLPSAPASQPPVRLICSCDSMPYGPLPGRVSIDPPRVIDLVAADPKDVGRAFSHHAVEVWASAQGPPPDLPFLRTVILLA